MLRSAMACGKTDGGWTAADGEMLEPHVWALWFRRGARKAGQCGVCVGEQILPACSEPVLRHQLRAIFVAAASLLHGVTLLTERLGGRCALPSGTWTLKGALTGRTLVAVPGVGAFIADTQASRTLSV